VALTGRQVRRPAPKVACVTSGLSAPSPDLLVANVMTNRHFSIHLMNAWVQTPFAGAVEAVASRAVSHVTGHGACGLLSANTSRGLPDGAEICAWPGDAVLCCHFLQRSILRRSARASDSVPKRGPSSAKTVLLERAPVLAAGDLSWRSDDGLLGPMRALVGSSSVVPGRGIAQDDTALRYVVQPFLDAA